MVHNTKVNSKMISLMDSVVNNFVMVHFIKGNLMVECSMDKGNSDGKMGVNMRGHGETMK